MEWVPIQFKGYVMGEVAGNTEPGEMFECEGKQFVVGGWADGKFTANMIVPDENGFPRFIDGSV